MKNILIIGLICVCFRVTLEVGYRAGFEDAWNVRFVDAPEYLQEQPIYDSPGFDSATESIESDISLR